MKKWLFLVCALWLCIPACNQSSGNEDTEKGFNSVSFSNDLIVLESKLYSFTHATMNYFCGPDSSCLTVLFNGTINDLSYVGFAAKYKNPDLPLGQSTNPDYANNSFKIHVYWSGSALSEGTITKAISEYTIKIKKPGVVYSVPTGNLNIDIALNPDGYYRITFNAPITVQNPANPSDTVTINNGDAIQTQVYSVK